MRYFRVSLCAGGTEALADALSDNPVLLPLGPSETHYDPLDFCYKTTMLRPAGLANFNFAYLVLPIALSTVCWLTIWLPWRLHRIVQAAAPRVDPFTEFGERRRDVAGEYERLLEMDTSPFSFLYQGELAVLAVRSELMKARRISEAVGFVQGDLVRSRNTFGVEY